MAGIQDFEKHQVDHLVLLVGSNPLPNYVTASLLAKPGGDIYLIHSVGTFNFAENIQRTLKTTLKNNNQFHLIEVDESAPHAINQKLSKEFSNIKNGTFGLNYTGGTKAMSVNAFHAMLDKKDAEYSYLDPRSLQMRFHKADIPGDFISTRNTLMVEFKDLTCLHGLEMTSGFIAKEGEKKLCIALSQNLKEWGEWWTEVRKRKGNIKYREISGENLPNISNLIPYFDGCSTIEELAIKWGRKKDGDDFTKWLEGEWLDQYTYLCLEGIFGKCGLSDIQININIKKPEFQFDVIAILGYQLFAISCSTVASKSMVKQKLFEAFIRSHQMGGEEARTAVVCGASKFDKDNNPTKIQNELQESWGAKGKIKVFGAEEIPDLSVHLEEWFKILETGV